MEENKKAKFDSEFALILKKGQERAALNQKLFSEIRTVIKEFSKFGKELATSTKEHLLEYLEMVQLKTVELKDAAEICQFLYAEKRKYIAKVIDSKIRKDGYDTKYYQSVIDQIIEPLLKDWESALEFEKRIPQSKQIVQSENVLQEERVEKTQPIEIINQNPPPVLEKISPKDISPISKLPDNFKQIQCDGSETEIMNFFMLLANSKNRMNDAFYMSENDVKTFVYNNFSIFKKEPTAEYFTINLLPRQKRILIYFIYQFTVKYNRKLHVHKAQYAMLLINNFNAFKNDIPKTLVSNMSESKRPKLLLDIIQIPK
ncbi:MAG: hypothetical protein K9H41_10120 [Bacteroidia bacterium]|jgi:hypothetical protein|nr:hypothetical protein [Bacteroidia bacterium]